MAITVNHIFTNPVADGTITSIVRPSDWNSAHKITFDASAGTGFTSTTTAGVDIKATNNTAGLSMAVPAFLTAAGGVQTAISGIVASNATYTSGTVYFSNQNNITIGSSVDGASQYVRLSVGNYLTTAMASNRGSDFVQATAVFAGTSASGTIASDGISVSVGPYLTTAMASNRASDFVAATAGFNGTSASGTIASNSISISIGPYITTARRSTDAIGLNTAGTNITWTANSSGLSINAGGYAGTSTGATNASVTLNTSGIAISVAAPGAAAEANAIHLLGANTAGSTTASGSTIGWSGINATLSGTNNSQVVISIPPTSSVVGASGISLSTDGSTVSIYQLSTHAGTGFTSTTTAGTEVEATLNTAGLSMAVPAFLTTAITTAALSNHSHGVSFTSGSVGFQTLSFTNSNGISFNSGTQGIFGSHNAITTARASTDAIGLNTAQTNVTWTVNSAGLSLNAGGYAGTGFTSTTTAGTEIKATNNTAGLSMAVPAYLTVAAGGAESNVHHLLGANTAGNTTASGTTIGLSGLGVTLSGTNGSQVVISAPPTSSLVGTSGISVSSNGSTISIYQPVAMQIDPYREPPVTNSTLGVSTLYFVPFDIVDMLSASRVNFFHSIAFTYSGAPNNSTAWLAAGYGLYTRGTGASTDRISLLTSYSMRYVSGSVSSSTRLSVTNYWQLSNATSHSTTEFGVNNATAGTYLTSSIAGHRPLAFPVNQLLTPGRYWMGYSVQHSNQGASFILSHTVMQAHISNQLAYRPFNVVSAASNASFWDASNGFGSYSAVSAGWPNSIPLTSDSIRAALVNTIPIFNISGIAQSSNIL